MDVLTKILDEMKKGKIRQKEITSSLGLSQKAFSEWEAGRTKSYMKYLPQIADVLGVSVDHMLGTDAREKFPTNLTSPEDVTFVPILGRVPAGVQIAAITDVEGTVDIPAAWTRSAEYFALHIRRLAVSEPKITLNHIRMMYGDFLSFHNDSF